MDWKVLWEALKEPLRLAVLAVIPFAITYFSGISTSWAIGATVILRFIDSWLHEIAKAEPAKKRNEGLLGVRGLTGF